MLISVSNLHVRLPFKGGSVHAVRGVDFAVDRGETLGIVGESGSGKSMSALSIINLLPKGAKRSADRIMFDGMNLSTLSERQMARFRGDRIAMIFQEPMTSLNPVYTVGNQMIEVYRRHRRSTWKEAESRACFLLDRVGVTNPGARLGQYPHQLSGGIRQRVAIAMALMCSPDVVIADEPTSALDVTIQAQILHLFKDIQREFGMALILITHDLGVVARIADRVAVMYAGEIVETGTSTDIFRNPAHPYTRGLLGSIPVWGAARQRKRLTPIDGTVPSLTNEIACCGFYERCPEAQPPCAEDSIPVTDIGNDHWARCLRATPTPSDMNGAVR